MRNLKRNTFLLLVLLCVLIGSIKIVLALTGPHGDPAALSGGSESIAANEGCAVCHKVHTGTKSARLWYESVYVKDGTSLVENLCRACHGGDGPGGNFDNPDDIDGVHGYSLITGINRHGGHLYKNKNHIDKDNNELKGYGPDMYNYKRYEYPDDADGGSMVSCYVCHDPHGNQFENKDTEGKDRVYLTRKQAMQDYLFLNDPRAAKRKADNYFTSKLWRKIDNKVWEKDTIRIRKIDRSGKSDYSPAYRELERERTEYAPSTDSTINSRDICLNCHKPLIVDTDNWGDIWGSDYVKAEDNDVITIPQPPVGRIIIKAGFQIGDTTDRLASFYESTEIYGPAKTGFSGFYGKAGLVYDSVNKLCVVGCHNPIVGEREALNAPDLSYNTAKWDIVDTTKIKNIAMTSAYKAKYGSTYIYYTKIACVSCHNIQGEFFDKDKKKTRHPYNDDLPIKFYGNDTTSIRLYVSRQMCLTCHDEHIKYQAPMPTSIGVSYEALVPAHEDRSNDGVRKELCIFCHPWNKPLVEGGTVCGSCHGFPPNYWDNKKDSPGVHETHVYGEGYSCSTCHTYPSSSSKGHNGSGVKIPDEYNAKINSYEVNVIFNSTITRTVADTPIFGRPFDTLFNNDSLRFNRRRGTHTYGYKIFTNPEKKGYPAIPSGFAGNSEVDLTGIEENDTRKEVLKYTRTKLCLECHDNEVQNKTGTKYTPLLLPLTLDSQYQRPLPSVNIAKYYFISGHGTANTATGQKVQNPAYKASVVTLTDCTDCHTPHGSRVFPLIKEYITDPHDKKLKASYDNNLPKDSNFKVSDNNICFACHANKLDNGFWPGKNNYEVSIHNRYKEGADSTYLAFDADTSKSWISDLSARGAAYARYKNRFRHDSTLNDSNKSGTNIDSIGGGRCVNCHNPHGDGSIKANNPNNAWGTNYKYDEYEYKNRVIDSTYKNMTNYPGAQLCYRCHVNPAADQASGALVSRVASRNSLTAPWIDFYNISKKSWIDSDIQKQFESTIEQTSKTATFNGSHHNVGGSIYNKYTEKKWLQRGDWGFTKVRIGNDTTVLYDWKGYNQALNDMSDQNGSALDDSRIECINCHNPHIVQRDNPATLNQLETLINPDPDNGVHPNSYSKSSLQALDTTFDTFFVLRGTAVTKDQAMDHFCMRCHDHDKTVPDYKSIGTYEQLDPPRWLYRYDSLTSDMFTNFSKDKYDGLDGLTPLKLTPESKIFFGELPRAVIFPKNINNKEIWKKWDKSWFYLSAGHGKYNNLEYNYDTTLSCLGCHNPHGTKIKKLLRTDTTQNAMIPTGSGIIKRSPVPQDNDQTFCLRCHEYPLNNGFWNGLKGWDVRTGYNKTGFTQYRVGYESSIHSKYPLSFRDRAGDKRNMNMYNPKKGYDSSDSGKCINCHDVHGAVDSTETNEYYSANGYPSMTYGYKENLCYQCHDYNAKANWGKDSLNMESTFNAQLPYTSMSRHDIDITWQKGANEVFDAPLDYTLGGAGPQKDDRRIECISCHNIHIITGKYEVGQIYTPVTNPENPAQLIRDYDTINDWTYGKSMNEFCLKCHDADQVQSVSADVTIDSRYKTTINLRNDNKYLPRPVIFPSEQTIRENEYPFGDQDLAKLLPPTRIWFYGNKGQYDRYYNKKMFYYNNGHGSDSTLSLIDTTTSIIYTKREPMNELCIGCHDPHASSNVKLVRDTVSRFANKSTVDVNRVVNYQQMVTSTGYPSGMDKDSYCNLACHKPAFKHAFTYVRNDVFNGTFVPDAKNPLIDTTYTYFYGNGGVVNPIYAPRRAPTGYSYNFTHPSNDYLPGVSSINYVDYPKAAFSDVNHINNTFNPTTTNYLAVDQYIYIGSDSRNNGKAFQRYTCMTCHNPHGTSSSTSRDPSWNWYPDPDSTENEGMTIYEPDTNEICNHCHNK